MMKWVFLLTLLLLGAVGAAIGGAAGFRWMNNMPATQRVMPGEYNFSMPPGFEMVVTCDQNIPYQQNLLERRIAVVILSTNRWPLNCLPHRLRARWPSDQN